MSLQSGKQILENLEQKTAASPTTSATEAGHTKQQQQTAAKAPDAKLVDAINQVFNLFRLNYHNQFFAAYSDIESLNLVKKLWLESLKGYSSDTILHAAKRALEESEYLPTLHRMLSYVQPAAQLGLPDVHTAYREACLAPSPKAEQQWSHAAVYLAGRDSDWFFLANNAEKQTLPVFEKHYQHWSERALAGETLKVERPIPIEQKKEAALSLDERQEAVQALRKEHGL